MLISVSIRGKIKEDVLKCDFKCDLSHMQASYTTHVHGQRERLKKFGKKGRDENVCSDLRRR